MVWEINGTDIMPYLLAGSITWTRKDMSGSNATTMQNGTTFRDRIASKYTFSATCRLLTAAELATVLTLLKPEYIQARITNPETHSVFSDMFFCDATPANYLVTRPDGTEYWSGLSFSIVQM